MSPTSSYPGHHQKRGRRLTACTECRRRRQRCDGIQPCANCQKRTASHLCSFEARTPRRSSLPGLNDGKRAAEQSQPEQLQTPPAEHGRLEVPVQSPLAGWLIENRGTPSFFGYSYFGPDIAAIVLSLAKPTHDQTSQSSRELSSSVAALEDENGVSSQVSRDLGLLRSKPSIDHLVSMFTENLNTELEAFVDTSFRKSYGNFWRFERGCSIDLSWVSLLYIVLACAVHLDVPTPCTTEAKRRTEQIADRFFRASKRFADLASSEKKESLDLIRAGLLSTRYLIRARRLAEAWLQIGHTVRLAIAQGLHVDGTLWNQTASTIHERRKLWTHLYSLDRMLALALGRPCSVPDSQCSAHPPEDDTASESDFPDIAQRPSSSSLARYLHLLSQIAGRVQEHCFGNERDDYDATMALDLKLQHWASSLPPFFQLEAPDITFDNGHPGLAWQRLYLHTTFHFMRITLHRSFLLKSSIIDRFRDSRESCIKSACADLEARLRYRERGSIEEFKITFAAHQLCSSALVLAIIALRDPIGVRADQILPDLDAYCEDQQSRIWTNACGLAECRLLRACKECIEGARKRHDTTGLAVSEETQNVLEATPEIVNSHMSESQDRSNFRPEMSSFLDQPENTGMFLSASLGSAERQYLDTLQQYGDNLLFWDNPSLVLSDISQEY